MAKQRGVIKIDGTIDDLTFYKTADGYLVRARGGVSAERIATDPVFQRTRENGAEFARAGKGARLMRVALRSELQNAKGRRVTSRLVREMMRVIKADAVNGRGLRNLVDGEKSLLAGFDFNENAQLSSTFFAPYTANIDRATGAATVTIPVFTPVNSTEAPAGATHFRLNSALVALDFETETYEYDGTAALSTPLDGPDTELLTLTSNVSANSTGALFLVLGVEFFQMVNNTGYSLKNGAFNALAIVEVNQA